MHCHDWTAGLDPRLLEDRAGAASRRTTAIRSVLTIHNIAYQGNFWHWDMELTGLDWKYFNWRQMEFYGNLSFLKTGLAFADALTTVSPRYAQEIQQPAAGLRAGRRPAAPPRRLVRHHQRRRLQRVESGDRPIPGRQQVRRENFAEGKRRARRRCSSEVGLPQVADRPLIAMIGRLADQKGFDLVAKLIPQWVPTATAQWVILGTGEPHYHQLLSELAQKYPDKVAVRLGFSERAGPPHRSRRGHVPDAQPLRAVRAQSALQPEIRHGAGGARHGRPGRHDHQCSPMRRWPPAPPMGSASTQYTTAALAEALERACQTYANRPVWEQLIRTGMRQDWSWNHSAREYGRLYELTMSRATTQLG